MHAVCSFSVDPQNQTSKLDLARPRSSKLLLMLLSSLSSVCVCVCTTVVRIQLIFKSAHFWLCSMCTTRTTTEHTNCCCCLLSFYLRTYGLLLEEVFMKECITLSPITTFFCNFLRHVRVCVDALWIMQLLHVLCVCVDRRLFCPSPLNARIICSYLIDAVPLCVNPAPPYTYYTASTQSMSDYPREGKATTTMVLCRISISNNGCNDGIVGNFSWLSLVATFLPIPLCTRRVVALLGAGSSLSLSFCCCSLSLDIHHVMRSQQQSISIRGEWPCCLRT